MSEIQGREGKASKDEEDGRTPVIESHRVVPLGLSFYLFVESQCAGRVVIDLSPHNPGTTILKQAGALEVLSANPSQFPLPFPSSSADLVLVGLSPWTLANEDVQNQLLREIRRLLRPNGFSIIRVDAKSLSQPETGENARTKFTQCLLAHFTLVEIVEETPFRGDSFFTSSSDDLVVSEAIARLAGNPSFLLGFCSGDSSRPWTATESLLVPTHVGESGVASDGEIALWRAEIERMTSRLAEIKREREEMRERDALLKDRVDRSNELVSRLRKEVERYQQQLSDETTAKELLAIERQQFQQKQQLLEAELEKKRWEVVRFEASVHALEKEVARLRASRGELPGAARSLMQGQKQPSDAK